MDKILRNKLVLGTEIIEVAILQILDEMSNPTKYMKCMHKKK